MVTLSFSVRVQMLGQLSDWASYIGPRMVEVTQLLPKAYQRPVQAGERDRLTARESNGNRDYLDLVRLPQWGVVEFAFEHAERFLEVTNTGCSIAAPDPLGIACAGLVRSGYRPSHPRIVRMCTRSS